MKNFEDLQIFTMTSVIWTNFQINLDDLFDKLDTLPSNVPLEKGSEANIKPGTIINLKYNNKLRGALIKKPKSNKTHFKNSLCVVMMIDKLINFKISSNGKFQVTGCKGIHHVRQLIKHLFDNMGNNGLKCTLREGYTNEEFIIQPVMYNVSFELDYYINRTALDQEFNDNTKFKSIYYPNDENFGLIQTLKYPIKEELTITYPILIKKKEGWEESSISYKNFIKTILDDKGRAKLKKKTYMISLMVHGKGKIIMSGFHFKYMKMVYKYFHQELSKCEDKVKIIIKLI